MSKPFTKDNIEALMKKHGLIKLPRERDWCFMLGAKYGRKQTLKEVLEQYRKVNNTWGFVLDFDRWLEQEIKEASK